MGSLFIPVLSQVREVVLSCAGVLKCGMLFNRVVSSTLDFTARLFVVPQWCSVVKSERSLSYDV